MWQRNEVEQRSWSFFRRKTKTADGATEKITVVENNGYTLKMLSNIGQPQADVLLIFN